MYWSSRIPYLPLFRRRYWIRIRFIVDGTSVRWLWKEIKTRVCCLPSSTGKIFLPIALYYHVLFPFSPPCTAPCVMEFQTIQNLTEGFDRIDELSIGNAINGFHLVHFRFQLLLLNHTTPSWPHIPPWSTPTVPSWSTTKPSTISAAETLTSNDQPTPTWTDWWDRLCLQSLLLFDSMVLWTLTSQVMYKNEI